MQICRACGVEKPDEAFRVRKESGKRRTECDECFKRLMRERYQADPEPRKAKIREYQAANPEKVRAWSRRNRPQQRRRQVYGMDRAAWDALVIAHGGCCAICGDQLVKPHIDHCHQTGAIRGLLCSACNTGIGLLRDDPALLHSAIAYLARQ